MILIPPALMSGMTLPQVELILAHEMAHLGRGDLLMNWFQRVVEAVYFFHPAVWYISHRISLERECTCDELVVASGWPAIEYAEALVCLANSCGSRSMQAGHLAAMLAATGKRPSQLKYRLLRLLGEPTPRMTRVSVAGMTPTILLLAIASIAWSYPADGRSPERHEETNPAEIVALDEVSNAEEMKISTSEPALDTTSNNDVAAATELDHAPFELAPLARVVFEGNSTISEAEIAKHVKSRVGRRVTQQHIKDDVDHLMRTRWFVSIEPIVRSSDEGPSLIFRVAERPIVRRVEYKGLKKVKQRVFDSLTQLKPGSPFEITSNRECARRIEEYYHEKGFVFATVVLEKGNDPADREVVFRINEGPKVHVTAVKFNKNNQLIEGVLTTKTRTKSRILSLFGGNYDPSTVKEDIAGVVQYYHSLGFFEVAIEECLKFSDDKANIEIHYEIAEGLRYRIRNVEISRNTLISDREFREIFDVSLSAHYNANQVDRAIELIKAKYVEYGCPRCFINKTLRCIEADGVVDLHIVVEEDPTELHFEPRIAGLSGDPKLLRYLKRALAPKQIFVITRDTEDQTAPSGDRIERKNEKFPQ